MCSVIPDFLSHPGGEASREGGGRRGLGVAAAVGVVGARLTLRAAEEVAIW
jgi:hypothetical protein